MMEFFVVKNVSECVWRKQCHVLYHVSNGTPNGYSGDRNVFLLPSFVIDLIFFDINTSNVAFEQEK